MVPGRMRTASESLEAGVVGAVGRLLACCSELARAALAVPLMSSAAYPAAQLCNSAHPTEAASGTARPTMLSADSHLLLLALASVAGQWSSKLGTS